MVLAALLSVALGGAPVLMNWPDLLGRPRPAPTRLVAYGTDPLQHAQLWLPVGKGPHPVALVVHGGCWQSRVAKVGIMDWLAEDLRQRGIAVWSLEYRGVDRPGGGYPGTFLDVAAGADALLAQAGPAHLDLKRLVAVGHSAGGHLALWLAARPKVPADSPLHAARPLQVPAVVALGALPDLELAQQPALEESCGAKNVHALTGAPTPGRPDVYRDTSPPELQPIPARQVLVNATLDAIAPPWVAEDYAGRARKAGVAVELVTVPDEGHVELIAPGTASFAAVVKAVQGALGAAAR